MTFQDDGSSGSEREPLSRTSENHTGLPEASPALPRTRRDPVCNNAACASTLTRTVWDGDQLLYEIRAPGGNVIAAQLEDDNATGPLYGRVAYTHGPGIDEPLDIVRMGFPLAVAASYGLGTWNGPYPVIPYADWHGSMEGATTPTGMQIPCNTTPNICTPGIWPASNLGAFYEPSAPADHQAWFGSLTTGKTDASGFMYMRNRYYNPQTGTFTQPDPIGIAGGLNVYGFAAGDPVTFDDPYGLCPPPSDCLAQARNWLFQSDAGQVVLAIVCLTGCAPMSGDVETALATTEAKFPLLRQLGMVEVGHLSGPSTGGSGLRPNFDAEGPHSTYRVDPTTEKITNSATWRPQTNPHNPAPWEQLKRVDVEGRSHYNKVTGEDVSTPHVHTKRVRGGVRPARSNEIP